MNTLNYAINIPELIRQKEATAMEFERIRAAQNHLARLDEITNTFNKYKNETEKKILWLESENALLKKALGVFVSSKTF